MNGLQGWVGPGFDRVLEAFVSNFDRLDETGASLVVYLEGERVVDLHGGVRDRASGRAWDDATLSVLFSATKGLVATCFLLLEDRGRLDLDAPVAAYWPGFGAHGKERISVRQVLDHRAGLAVLDEPIGLDDLELWATGQDPASVVGVLERQRPCWEPGTDQGYHAVTFGLLTGEIFRRVTGEDLGPWMRREVLEPVGADVWLGLPADLEHRVATLYPSGPLTLARDVLPSLVASRGPDGRLGRRLLRRDSLSARAFRHPEALGFRGVSAFDTPRVHRLALPWASGIATADGLARVYRALVGRELVGEAAIERVARRASWGWDRVLCKPLGFSQGFLKEELSLYSPNPRTFGHTGAGGTLAFGDPDARLAFAYTLNRMDPRLRSPRALALARATYASLGRPALR